MRKVEKKWFTIESYGPVGRTVIKNHPDSITSMDYARYQWSTLSDDIRNNSSIEIVVIWAVYDRESNSWIPVKSSDEEFDYDLMKDHYIDNYTVTAAYGKSYSYKVYADTVNGIVLTNSFNDMPEEFELVSEKDFINSLNTLSDDEIIGARVTPETLQMLIEEYGVCEF